MSDGTMRANNGDDGLGYAFDVRLVGQRNVLDVRVRRDGDAADGDIVCDLAIGSVSCRDGKSVTKTAEVTGASYEDVAEQAVDFVSAEGHRIRNLTRFRYDVESAVRSVDIAIRRTEGDRPLPPRDDTIAVSMRQVREMMDDLPMEIGSHVDRMIVDTFQSAVRNVIAAAYDAGYRDGQLGADARRDLFDYEAAAGEDDMDAICW